jgi:multiple sugar transport system permease protein
MAQATAAPGSAHSAVAKENKKAIQARNLRTGLLFTAPALIVLAIFVFYPAIKTFITSLTSDRINRAGKFVGFDNYVKLFQSADFWTDVKNTLVYAVAYAPIVVIVALAFALLLNRKDLKFVGFFRTCMFLPFVISLTVAAIAWQFILSPSLGLVPYWIQQLTGIAHVDLLGTRETAMAAIVFITVWKNFGYFMVIFLAGLQGISAELYEAASLDGASAWQKFRYITLPALRDLQLCGHLRPHRFLPGLRSGLHPDLRRPGTRHRNHRVPHLHRGIRQRQARLRIRTVVRAADHDAHRGPHPAVHQQQA